MPEYLAPGVYVEEVSFRSKSIEGVGTTTTGFVGPTRYGPVNLEPDIVTSLGEFERVYGDREQLAYGNADDDSKTKMHNFMWHAVRAFFEEGGKRLYISRTFRPVTKFETNSEGKRVPVIVSDGYAKAYYPPLKAGETKPKDTDKFFKVRARLPGELGKLRVWLTLRIGQSILGKRDIEVNGKKKEEPTVAGLLDRDVVYIENMPAPTSPPTSPPPTPTDKGFYLALKKRDTVTGEIIWEFQPMKATSSPPKNLELKKLDADDGDRIRIVNFAVTTKAVENPEADTRVYDGLALDSDHKRAGTPDSIFDKFAEDPASAAEARRLPIVIEGNLFKNGLDVLKLSFDANDKFEGILLNENSTDDDRSFSLLLSGGNDGMRPTATEYEGEL